MFNILVVDDQAHIRRLYEYTLEKNGYQPYTAGDGAQALKLMETTHIDLVILDLMMPTMDGYTFLKTMRDSGNSIPVLIITARDSAEDVRKAFTMGTDDFMVKPVDDVEMILRIRALLRRARISEEQKITVGSTTLIYDSFTLIQNGSPDAEEGVPDTVQAAVIPEQDLHPREPYGGVLGHGQRIRGTHGGRPHQPPARPPQGQQGYPDSDRPGAWL